MQGPKCIIDSLASYEEFLSKDVLGAGAKPGTSSATELPPRI